MKRRRILYFFYLSLIWLFVFAVAMWIEVVVLYYSFAKEWGGLSCHWNACVYESVSVVIYCTIIDRIWMFWGVPIVMSSLMSFILLTRIKKVSSILDYRVLLAWLVPLVLLIFSPHLWHMCAQILTLGLGKNVVYYPTIPTRIIAGSVSFLVSYKFVRKNACLAK